MTLRRNRHRTLAVVLAAHVLLAPLSQAQMAPAVDPRAVLAQARELTKSGDYDATIELLNSSRDAMRSEPELLAQNYLEAIKAHVYMGNNLRTQPQGRESARLNYERASELIAECLRLPALRHTRPEPESDYPPEMVQQFRDVRGKVQGGLRVNTLEPEGATVLLEGDTLRASGDAGVIEVTDLAVGTYRLEVRAPGHVSLHEQVEITPGSTSQLEYTLDKRRGPMWYVTRVAALGGAVVAVVLVTRPKSSGGESDLPPPPDPPSAPHR